MNHASSSCAARRTSSARRSTAWGGLFLRVAVLGLPEVPPVTGGLPVMSAGKVIGVSGVTSEQDEQIARAGMDGWQ